MLFLPWLSGCQLIRMQDPLKQGLKQQLRLFDYPKLIQIRMQDPLKQGLKLIYGGSAGSGKT